MTRNIIKYIFIVLITFSFFEIEASSVNFQFSKNSIGIMEEFYVDVMLDTEGQAINGIEGTINVIGDNIRFIRAENGKSFIDLWVLPPKETSSNQIKFAGVSSTNFQGVIDPFNQEKNMPGIATRLYFIATKPGESQFILSGASVTLSDGKGTKINLPTAYLPLVIESRLEVVTSKIKDITKPELKAQVIQNINLFDNQYALIYKANDKDSGIKKVLIKEGNSEWREITSPYLLEDQTRQNQIVIKAINFSDLERIIKINPKYYKNNSALHIFIAVIVIILLTLIKKRKIKNNKLKN